MTRIRRLSLALALALLLPLGGCDALDSLLGEFEGRRAIAGASESVDGEAIYTVVETAGGPRFVLGLFVDGLTASSRTDYDYVVFRLPDARPDVGAYAVDDRASGARVFTATLAHVEDAGRDEARGTLLRGTGGTLTVERVDGYGFLLGSFQVDATGLRIEAPGATVAGSASGRFEARYEPPAVFQRLGIAL